MIFKVQLRIGSFFAYQFFQFEFSVYFTYLLFLKKRVVQFKIPTIIYSIFRMAKSLVPALAKQLRTRVIMEHLPLNNS